MAETFVTNDYFSVIFHQAAFFLVCNVFLHSILKHLKVERGEIIASLSHFPDFYTKEALKV